MNGLLKEGTILISQSGNRYTVNKLLGAGGQGEVYDVECAGKHFALKWYYKHTATRTQKSILDNLISKGKPDESFLWPEDLIYKQGADSFGYIMKLRPSRYKSIVDLMKRKAEPSFYTLCKVAFNMTKGYQKLHQKGYSYRDISFGNLFFDPDTGDVLICDNDNVAVNGMDECLVYGTPRFMAPEIVVGDAKPSRNTDLFSLSVLLFYMFMLNHPLEGKLEAEIKCMDIHAMNKLYGSNPLFIFDPDNKSNRPIKEYQENALIFWDLYPDSLKKMFIQSFTVGLSLPNRRVTENKWLEVISNLMSGIIECPNCGAEVFYDKYKEDNNVTHICWGCDSNIKVPVKMIIDKKIVILKPQAKLYSNYVNNDNNMDKVVGTVVKNPNNPNVWGIRNEDDYNWIYEKADGTQIVLEKERSAAIAKGAKIHFKNCIGKFE